MTRTEAVLAVLIGLALVTSGLTWLFGPYGLLSVGVVFGGLGLVAELKD